MRQISNCTQPRMVGSFSGGPGDWQRGAPYFFKCGKAGEQTRAGGQHFCRVGPAPVGPPGTTGLTVPYMCVTLLPKLHILENHIIA